MATMDSTSGRSPERNNDLSTAPVDLPAPDLHDLAYRNGFVTAKIENAFENEVRVQSGGPEGGCVTRLEGEGKQCSRVEGSVVIGIAGQDEAMCQSFKVLRLESLAYASSHVNQVGNQEMSRIAIKKTYHVARSTATVGAGTQMIQASSHPSINRPVAKGWPCCQFSNLDRAPFPTVISPGDGHTIESFSGVQQKEPRGSGA